jgi:folate-binding protein YgfZ
MDPRLAESLTRSGASLLPHSSRPEHFGDPRAELSCAFGSCVLGDRSQLARILATGRDFLDLLHRLSTADIASLPAGQGKPTILTTSKGRIVERLFVHNLGAEGVLSVGGPGAGPAVLQHLARYTFSEDTGLSDATEASFQLVLIGPRAAEALQAVGVTALERFSVVDATIGGVTVRVLGSDGLSGEGFSITASNEHGPAVWDALVSTLEALEGRPAGDQALEAYRVLRGLPLSGHELSEDHNPLEAGQWDAVSFDKGCYVGQEVVARLNTYDKVSRSLVGLVLPAGSPLPAPGTALHDAGRRVGRLTSAVNSPDRPTPIGLGYLKKQALRPKLEVQVGEQSSATARVLELPFPYPAA